MTKLFQELLWKYVKVQKRRPIKELVAEIGITPQAFNKWLMGLVKHLECEKVQRCAIALRLNPAEEEEFMQTAGCPFPALPKPAELIPVVGKPIFHPSQLFGREKALTRIYEAWKQQPVLYNLAIVGPRRSGRTSLLNYLKEIANTPSQHLRSNQPVGWPTGWLPKNFRFALVSFKDKRMREEPDCLIKTVLEQLQLKIPTACSMDDFIQILNQPRQPTVILLDDVERGMQSPQLAAVSFWRQLRFLGSSGGNGRIGLVVTRTPDLPPDPDPDSPFLNIFSVLTLPPFTAAEARELLATSPLSLSEEEIEWILTQSGGWPAALQELYEERLHHDELAEKTFAITNSPYATKLKVPVLEMRVATSPKNALV